MGVDLASPVSAPVRPVAAAAGGASARPGEFWPPGPRPGSGATRHWLPGLPGPGAAGLDAGSRPAGPRGVARRETGRPRGLADRLAPAPTHRDSPVVQGCQGRVHGRAGSDAATTCGRATRAAAGVPNAGWAWSGCRDLVRAADRRPGTPGRRWRCRSSPERASRAGQTAAPATRCPDRDWIRWPRRLRSEQGDCVQAEWPNRPISSAVERLPYKQDVAGSKPASGMVWYRALDPKPGLPSGEALVMLPFLQLLGPDVTRRPSS